MIIGAVMVPHPPVIIPEIGKGQEKEIQKTIDAYESAATLIQQLQPDTLVIISPHTIMYNDYFHISPRPYASGNFAKFGAYNIKDDVDYDVEFVNGLCNQCLHDGFPAGTLGEKDPSLDHGTLIPLYFIKKKFTNFKVIRIGLSGLSLEQHYRLGMYIQEISNKLNRRTFVIGSGDLSHVLKEDGPYGYKEDGPIYDSMIMKTMGSGEFGELFTYDEGFLERAQECGHSSFTIMAGALDGLSVISKQLSYEGPFGVGYGICTYLVAGKDETRHYLKNEEKIEDVYVSLAKKTVEQYVGKRTIMTLPDDLPDELTKLKAGVFVSIHKKGELRGCIGTIEPTQDCIGREIIQNAISASSKDPRFTPIRPNELHDLTINVDVLNEPESITSLNQLDIKKYGVIVSKDFRKGLLLPDLDDIKSVEEQVKIAKAKAGIEADEEGVMLQRFTVTRHK